MTTKEMTVDMVRSKDGAGTIAMLVQIASRFDSSIYIEDGPVRVNAKSIMGMMNMNMTNGQKICVTADGTDERSAIAKIEEYVTGNH